MVDITVKINLHYCQLFEFASHDAIFLSRTFFIENIKYSSFIQRKMSVSKTLSHINITNLLKVSSCNFIRNTSFILVDFLPHCWLLLSLVESLLFQLNIWSGCHTLYTGILRIESHFPNMKVFENHKKCLPTKTFIWMPGTLWTRANTDRQDLNKGNWRWACSR